MRPLSSCFARPVPWSRSQVEKSSKARSSRSSNLNGAGRPVGALSRSRKTGDTCLTSTVARVKCLLVWPTMQRIVWLGSMLLSGG